MRLEHYPFDKLKTEILSIIGKYLDLSKYKIFFFGSRVTGRGDDRSGIDVGIEGPERISGDIMENIRDEIESLPTLYTIEIVDFRCVSEDFYRVAKKTSWK